MLSLFIASKLVYLPTFAKFLKETYPYVLLVEQRIFLPRLSTSEVLFQLMRSKEISLGAGVHHQGWQRLGLPCLGLSVALPLRKQSEEKSGGL